MTAIKGELEHIIESAVNALGVDFVGCELAQSGKSTLLRVYVDEINGIDIDMIEKASRQISAVLDVEEPFSGRYVLEVSSPGLERPLFRLDDYRRFMGRSIKLRLRIPKEDDRRHYTGKLISVEHQRITMAMECGEKITMDFEEIDKANLVPEF